MESTIVSIVECREGCIVDPTTCQHWIGERCPQWVHNGHSRWLDIESAMDGTIVSSSSMTNTEEFTVVH
eukprot:11168753-Lingulodinium_polyedra.AAC.1